MADKQKCQSLQSLGLSGMTVAEMKRFLAEGSR